jgi:hypothetical protein
VLNPFGGLGKDLARIRVVEERTEKVEGTLLDVLLIETTWNHMTTRTLMTKEGEIIRQDIGPPLGLVLRNQFTREHAVRGFEP